MVLFSIFVQATLVTVALAASPPVGCLQDPPAPGCEPVLARVNEAVQLERTHTVDASIETDPFYQTPSNLSSYSPGDPIRLEKPAANILEKYSVPPGVTLYRMIYLSTDMDNKPVPASAFVLIPYTHSLTDSVTPRLEVIAWAHGTSGIERRCAPSTQDDLYYQYEAPFSMALQGFAVIAPDYAGQGTNTTFNYLAGPSHAADVANAVIAARNTSALCDILSERWVVVGHSEGGLTAWATNEREAQLANPTPGFIGAVSVAPALANLEIISTNLEKTGGKLGDTLLYSSYTLTTIKRLNPSVDVTKYYSAVGLERAALAARGCFNTALAAFQGLTFGDVFMDGSWLNSTFAKDWETRTGVRGEKKLAKPMLLVAGLNDTAVPSSVIEDAWTKQCQTHADAKVHLTRYPGLDHDPVAWASQLEYFDWIRDLFNGTGPEKCSNTTVDPEIPDIKGGNSTSGGLVARR